jgi:hypothetical protein
MHKLWELEGEEIHPTTAVADFAAWLMRPICKVDDTLQVQIDEAASCGRCYTCRCV